MGSTNLTRKIAGSVLVPALAFGGVQTALGQEEAPEMKVSASLGADWNSHFISYGFDVWGTGNDFGENSTLNPWAEVGFDFGAVSFVAGTWWDINDNAGASLGGDIQEEDFYWGLGYSIDKFSFGITYQDWHYAGGVEQVLDLSVGYDDSDLWGGDFALNPSLTLHKRLASTNIGTVAGGDENGWVAVLGIEPGMTLIDSEDYPVELTFPVSVGYFFEEGFHGAKGNGTVTDEGFGFFSVGVSASMPLTFIPAEYGDWSLGAGVKAWYTDDEVIGNPDEFFLTANVGFTLSF